MQQIHLLELDISHAHQLAIRLFLNEIDQYLNVKHLSFWRQNTSSSSIVFSST